MCASKNSNECPSKGTRAQGRLVDSAALFRKFLADAPPHDPLGTADWWTALDERAIVAIADPFGRINLVNDKFCELSKYSREELVGQSPHLLVTEKQPRPFLEDLWKTISAGGVWHGEVENRAKDGSHFWVALTVYPILDGQGVPSRFIAIGSDITEQKRLEDALGDSLRLQRLLAELATRFGSVQIDGVDAAIEETQRLIVEALRLDRSTLWQLAEHGPGMTLTHFSRGSPETPLPPVVLSSEGLAWSLAKIMRGEVICFSSLDHLPPEAAADAELFRGHGLKSNVTIPLVANNRVFGALSFGTVTAERNWRDEEIVEFKLVAQIIGNVVGRQRAERNEDQLRGELAHAMRVSSLGHLVAALAHELNQPLTAILSNAQAARRFLASGEMNPDELRAILDDMVRDDKRAGNVINSVRAMISKRPLAREACSLNELVREVAGLMRGEFLEAKIELRPTLDPALPSLVVNRVELQQVLVNFFVNAVHAMDGTPPDARFIDVETRAEGTLITVTVRDRGHGIPPEKLPSIFDPFVSTKENGLGLGLSICRRIIESHGGSVEARNRARGGASFSFALPILEPLSG